MAHCFNECIWHPVKGAWPLASMQTCTFMGWDASDRGKGSGGVLSPRAIFLKNQRVYFHLANYLSWVGGHFYPKWRSGTLSSTGMIPLEQSEVRFLVQWHNGGVTSVRLHVVQVIDHPCGVYYYYNLLLSSTGLNYKLQQKNIGMAWIWVTNSFE